METLNFLYSLQIIKRFNKIIKLGESQDMVSLKEMIEASLGKTKLDLLIRNANVINVFTGDIEKKDVGIFKGLIIGFGDYEAKNILDIEGDFLCPGFIDSHVHIESSMVTIPEFARAVLPQGTTTVVIDPHEIANVLGKKGILFMADSSTGVPLNIFIMLPSCVPSTSMETSGAKLKARDLRSLIKKSWVIGLAEMMNYPGVIGMDPEVLKKIEMVKGKRIDGHAPSLSGRGLYAYITAGIRSDHESTTLKEAEEKLKNGMWIMVREGSSARNLRDIVPLINSKNSRRFLFVTDDRHPKEIFKEGHISSMVRNAIQMGVDPIISIQMATLNGAEYFGLNDLGAIAPGYRADMITFNNLKKLKVKKVFKDGKLVAENGQIIPGSIKPFSIKKILPKRNTIHIKDLNKDSFILRSYQPLAKVIQVIPDQIVTKKVLRKIILKDGVAYPNIKEDILKVAVIERHKATGHIGLGFVQGFGIKKGAIGSSIAHDSHNLVIVGTNEQDMLKAVNELRKLGGGLVVIKDEKILSSLPLPVAGLMADTSALDVYHRLEELKMVVKSLGCKLPDPFMTISFISLPVIPELKITDKGLVDVNQFKIVPVFGED